MRTLTKKIILSVGLSSLVFLGACKETERILVQPATSESVASLPDSNETLNGPITHGGDVMRARAREIKRKIDAPIDLRSKKDFQYRTFTNHPVRTSAYVFWMRVWQKYDIDNNLVDPEMRELLDVLFDPEHNIIEEVLKSPINVKTFAPYDYDGTEEDYERKYGHCTAVNSFGVLQRRTASTRTQAFSEICIDAKMLAKSNPDDKELVALISGHEMIHHFGFEKEDGVVSIIEDFVRKNYRGLDYYRESAIKTDLANMFTSTIKVLPEQSLKIRVSGENIIDEKFYRESLLPNLLEHGVQSGVLYMFDESDLVLEGETSFVMNFPVEKRSQMQDGTFAKIDSDLGIGFFRPDKLEVIVDGEVVWEGDSDYYKSKASIKFVIDNLEPDVNRAFYK